MSQRPHRHRPPGYQALRYQLARDQDAQRPSASARGYDRYWQRCRAAFLLSHPLCAACHRQGRLTPALHVHHVAKLADAPELRLDHDNLEALCASCHSRCTRRGD